MGFDFGLRRIGVAIGQTITGTATPLMPLNAREGTPDWQVVAALIKEWQPATAIVGEPLQMDGSDSEMTRRARKFANRIYGRFGVKVVMADERLTSFEVKGWVKERYGPQNFGDFAVDSLAAMVIVEQWLQGSDADLV
jgi:putative Holliday junction resolvase